MMVMMASVLQYLSKRGAEIRKALGTDNLWQRMLKNTVAITCAVGLSLIHYNTQPAFGKASYLSAMVAVFAHPGRRVGQLVEAIVLVLLGLIIGVAWGLLGFWLSSLLIHSNPSAAYSIRALFVVSALMYHGFFRAHTPRMFLVVLTFIIVNYTALTTTTEYITSAFVTSLAFPVLMALGVVSVVGLCILPEFSSSYLGETTIDNIKAAAVALQKAGYYFVGEPNPSLEVGQDGKTKELPKRKDSMENDMTLKPTITDTGSRSCLADITASKDGLRSKLLSTRHAQNETQFEIAVSHLHPRLLSPISKTAMKRLVTHTIAIIGTCESRFALLGDGSNEERPATPATPSAGIIIQNSEGIDVQEVNLDLLKPAKEIEFGDVRLLEYLLTRIKGPYISFQENIQTALDALITSIAYAYDVRKIPSKSEKRSCIKLEELETVHSSFKSALKTFEADISAALESAAALQDLRKEKLDIMPREEIFLISSFLLNIRQAATQIIEMLDTAKLLVQQRAESEKWRRVFLPQIKWRKWLYSGGEMDDSLPPGERRTAHTRRTAKNKTMEKATKASKRGRDTEMAGEGSGGKEAETKLAPTAPVTEGSNKSTDSPIMRLRQKLSDILDWMRHSEDLEYAFKLTVATMLVTFPAFVPSLNTFYSRNRGSWAALQLIFVFDVAIGTSIYNAYIRAIGTTLGSLWGWAAYEAADGNPYVCTVMLFVGLIPATYVQLGSKYAKAGIVTITSMCVVALATELQTVPGTGTENFLSRWIAFLIGGVVALIVQVILLPVKARARLVSALTATIQRIGEMEACIGYGVDEGDDLHKGFPPFVFESFETASTKAKKALDVADTFLPYCSSEPRLKGSFEGAARILEEMIFVLRQVVDKMDNMIQLRLAYGAGPQEEFNTLIYPYRRNAAGAVSLVLYAVHEALMTKYPLPQFMPSARLAHLRLINRIREVVEQGVETSGAESEAHNQAIKHTLRRKYMSWNAASAAQGEIIEYLEELTDLVKLLVGSNQFSSGLLARPTLQEYARAAGYSARPAASLPTQSREKEHRDDKDTKLPRQEDDLPISLQRIQSRKQEATLKKRRQRHNTVLEPFSLTD